MVAMRRREGDGERVHLEVIAMDIEAAYDAMAGEDMRANARVALRVLATLIEEGREVTCSELAQEIGRMVMTELKEKLGHAGNERTVQDAD